MGAVYQAFDVRLNRTVAIKETLVETPELRRAFEREAHLLANLRHPALPNVIDHFSEGDGLFLVMEFIPGRDLAEMLIERGHRPFDVAEVIAWADQLLDALDYLHSHRPPVIHRDIKPSNLKLISSRQIVLLDFGLAKGAGGQQQGEATRARVDAAPSVLGYTPSYAPLEQIQGAGTNVRSDLYALGATLYHLLTGLRPPDALIRASAVLHQQPDPLAAPQTVNSQVNSSLNSLLLQTLALNSAERPISALALRQALRAGDAHAPTEIYDQDETTVVASEQTRASAAGGDHAAPPPVTSNTFATTRDAAGKATRLASASPPQMVIPLEPAPEEATATPTAREISRTRWAWLLTTFALASVAAVFFVWALFFRTPTRGSDRVAINPTTSARNVNARAANVNANQNQPTLTPPTPPTPAPTLAPINSPDTERARAELARRNLPFEEATFLRAAERGETADVGLYLAARINPDAADERGRTALHLASRGGRERVTRQLIESGANVNVVDARNATPLIDAAEGGHTDTALALVERAATLDAQDALGRTALIAAAKNGHREVVLMLINRGAQVNARDADGRNARQWAEINDHDDIAELLKKAGAK